MGASANHSTFPPNRADNVHELDSVLANDRRSFDELHTLKSHWLRPFTRSFYWMVTFDQDEKVAELARSCQENLRFPYLDHISDETLHLTLRRARYGDDVNLSSILRDFEHYRENLVNIGQFRLGLFPLAGSPGAVRFSVFPWAPLTRVFDVLTSADKGRATASSNLFRPHVGVAYVNESTLARPIVQQVANLRSLSPHWTTVKSIDLVDLWRSNNSYNWSKVLSCELKNDLSVLGSSDGHNTVEQS